MTISPNGSAAGYARTVRATGPLSAVAVAAVAAALVFGCGGDDGGTVSRSELLPALRSTGLRIIVRTKRRADHGEDVLVATAIGPRGVALDFAVTLASGGGIPTSNLGKTLLRGQTSGTANGNFTIYFADGRVPRRDRRVTAIMAVTLEKAVYSQAPDLYFGV